MVCAQALLFGDAMSLNVHQFLRAAWQCLLLAGPGVVCSALLTAFFMIEVSPYGFPFSLAMTQGAILASTCVEIEFQAPHAIEQPNSLVDLCTCRRRRTPLPSWASSSPRARARFSRYR